MMRRTGATLWFGTIVGVVVVLLACGCGDDTANDQNNNTNQNTNQNNNQNNNNGPVDWNVSGDPDTFHWCGDAQVPTGLPTVDWENVQNELITQDDDNHYAQDAITVSDRAARIGGKFTYGALSVDLEGEWIEVWVDNCSGSYLKLGEARTDSDGRIALPVPIETLPPVGAYAVYLRVMGDNTSARSTFWMLRPGTQVMIFDIDGTLTTDDMELFTDIVTELFEPLGSGDYVPAARAGATNLTSLRHDTQGYVLVYLTGRPYNLIDVSRRWLADLGFPPGPLHLADDMADILPTNQSVGDYKAGYLNELLDLGLVIEAAYGNASTDIYAYAQVGVDTARTFITGPNGGDGGTVDLGDDYQNHLPDAQAEADATQPFSW